MFKTILISLITCLCLTGQGQVLNFNSMNASKTNWYVRTACADTSGNIYMGGLFSKIDTTYYWGVAKWDGTKWDSLNHGMFIPGQILTISDGARALAYYKNEVYAGGSFTTIDGKPIRYIAKWNGNYWDSLPKSVNATADGMIVCNGKLYIFGGFNRVGTAVCTKMAVWDGSVLTPVILPYSVSELGAVAVYNNELYVGGIFFNGSSDGCLAKFDGTNWSIVGGGIKGGIVSVNTLKVFNNELYIGGWIEKSAGNAGDFLMKWDGTSYKEVIGGLDGQIWKLTEVPDGLIATGCFTHPYVSVLKIGANGVCGYNDTLDNCIIGSVYANNNLYFYGGFHTVNGDSAMACINNVNYTTQTDSCMAFINGVNEINSVTSIKVFPNTATSILNINDEQNQLQDALMQISNSIGQEIITKQFAGQIDVSILPAGYYYITITTRNRDILRSKFIKQ